MTTLRVEYEIISSSMAEMMQSNIVLLFPVYMDFLKYVNQA